MNRYYKRIFTNGKWWINIELICEGLNISVVDQIKWFIEKGVETKSIFGNIHIEEMYCVGWIITLTNTEGANVDDVMALHALIYENLNKVPCLP